MAWRDVFMGPDGARGSIAPLVITLAAVVVAVIVTSHFWSMLAMTVVLSVVGCLVYGAVPRAGRRR